MKFQDIERRRTTKVERVAIRKEYQSWRKGDIEINGWSWKRWRKKAYGNQRGKCYYCHKMTKLPNMQVDHRVPVYYGGPNDLANFILACRGCNQFKAQHYLLRGKDRNDYALAKAVIKPGKPDYNLQWKAWAQGINAVMDEQMWRAINYDT